MKFRAAKQTTSWSGKEIASCSPADTGLLSVSLQVPCNSRSSWTQTRRDSPFWSWNLSRCPWRSSSSHCFPARIEVWIGWSILWLWQLPRSTPHQTHIGPPPFTIVISSHSSGRHWMAQQTWTKQGWFSGTGHQARLRGWERLDRSERRRLDCHAPPSRKSGFSLLMRHPWPPVISALWQPCTPRGAFR